MKQRKRFSFELKEGAKAGAFRAVFATFGVVDLDGDVTNPGAFKNGAPVIIGSWGHKTSDLPVGRGVIVADQREAAVEGEFFLDTEQGKATYQTVKNLGELGEWSYVFTVLKQSYGQHEGRPVRFLEDIEVFSVDPVLKGAGIDTRTTDIKSLGFVEHGEEIGALVAGYLARVKERTAIREKESRGLSAANVASLGELAESLKALSGELGQLIAPAESNDTDDEAMKAWWEVQRAQRLGV